MTSYNIETSAAHFVRQIFSVHRDPRLLYHNLAHTERVVAHATAIAASCSVDPGPVSSLVVAGWFHDVGQLFGASEGHEQRSIDIYEGFIHGWNVGPAFNDRVVACIEATRMPQKPGGLLEAIICDADLYNIGTPDFVKTDLLLREETRLRTGAVPPDWDERTLHLLQTHRFFTPYCQVLLATGLEKNLQLVEARLAAKKS
ncbi:HD domain-containing protein [Flaviaesturariibacter terrae]